MWINGVVVFLKIFSLLFSRSLIRLILGHEFLCAWRCFVRVCTWYRFCVYSLHHQNQAHQKLQLFPRAAHKARLLTPRHACLFRFHYAWCSVRVCMWRKLISDYSQMENVYTSELYEYAFSSIWAVHFFSVLVVSFTSSVSGSGEKTCVCKWSRKC